MRGAMRGRVENTLSSSRLVRRRRSRVWRTMSEGVRGLDLKRLFMVGESGGEKTTASDEEPLLGPLGLDTHTPISASSSLTLSDSDVQFSIINLPSFTPLSYPFTWIHAFLIFSLIIVAFIISTVSFIPPSSLLFFFFLTFFLFLSLSIFPFPADFNNQIYKQKTIPPSIRCWCTSYYILFFFIYWKWKFRSILPF